ncbi:MAG TPA: HAD-IA family hydrolase [Pseudomonadales bacterium]
MVNTKTLDRKNYRTLSFDCYGTLVDWENGILGYLQPLLASVDAHVIDEWVLEFYAEVEPKVQAEGGSYRSVLARVLERFARRLGFTPDEDALTGFAASIEYWQPFPDTVAALERLAKDFDLIALSNIDDDLFSMSARLLGNPFKQLISAQRVGAYKPDPRMFRALLEIAEGPVLHVAQSRFHDIVPATAAGLDTVWINRPSLGAVRQVDAMPTWTFDSLADFAAAWS